jgi:carbon monoxide dehydrogenase subunit G
MLAAMTWYPLEPADDDIFSSAPLIYRHRIELAATPAQVWESLASDESLAAWGPGAKSVTWLNPRPFGVDTTREVALVAGVAKVREHFFRWDEGQGYSFYVYEASLPVFKQFAENYVVETDGPGSVLTWTVAIVPKPRFALPMRVLSPVNTFAFGRTAADAKRYFAK